jgi:hypothetical protein
LAAGNEFSEELRSMSAQPRCACRRCTIRGLMGPAVITTLGVLFLLSEVVHGEFSFMRTYPILLIVIGAILLGSAVAPMDGHVSETVVPQIAPPPPSNPPVAPTPFSGQGQ